MRHSRFARELPISLGFLLSLTIILMVSLCVLSLKTMSAVLEGQRSHAESFVPAKRISADFERQILNARIFFIYYVTIQKPESFDKGWQRYHQAEARLTEMSAQVDAHAELDVLAAPVAKLRTDLGVYHLALLKTMQMVKDGELRGPHYDAQVKEWAARGATLVTDAGEVEQLCSTTSESSTDQIVNTLQRNRRQLSFLLGGNVLLCIAGTLLLSMRLKRLFDEALHAQVLVPDLL